jgi:hypothetical protein
MLRCSNSGNCGNTLEEDNQISKFGTSHPRNQDSRKYTTQENQEMPEM